MSKITTTATMLMQAIGDICSRFINADGRPCSPEIDVRTVGIQLDELRLIPTRILVAGRAERLRRFTQHSGLGTPRIWLPTDLVHVDCTNVWVADPGPEFLPSRQRTQSA